MAAGTFNLFGGLRRRLAAADAAALASSGGRRRGSPLGLGG
jgi:hypothetical protein